MKTLDAYCTSILRLINLILSEHLDLVYIKKHLKFQYKRTIALCVIAYPSLKKSSKWVHVQTLLARNARISRHIKLIFRIDILSFFFGETPYLVKHCKSLDSKRISSTAKRIKTDLKKIVTLNPVLM